MKKSKKILTAALVFLFCLGMGNRAQAATLSDAIPRQAMRIPSVMIRSASSKKKTKKLYISGKSSPYLIVRGKTRQLKVRVKGAKKTGRLRFHSSNRKIVSVNRKGKIRAKAAGTAVITVRSSRKSIRAAKLTVTVTPTKYIAHRGLRTKAPDDSSAAFTLAGRAGFWGTECDVYESKHDRDGSFGLIISHEENLKQFCGVNANIRDLSIRQLTTLRVTGGRYASRYNQKLCTYQHYLDICRKYDMMPFVDIKDNLSDDGVHMLIDSLARRNLLNKVHFVGSQTDTFRRAQDYAQSRYGIKPSISMNISYLKYDREAVINAVRSAKKLGFTGISLRYNLLSKSVMRKIKKYGLEMNAFGYSASRHKRMKKDIKKYHLSMVMVDGMP